MSGLGSLAEGSGMWVPPVIERELRIALRKHGAVKSRFRVAILGAAAVSVFLFFNWGLGTGFSGRTLHTIFFYAGLYLAVIPAAQISVGLFCEERRNQTLELLYLTGMGSGQLFMGKLLAGIFVASSDLLALAPLLAIPFFSGGVSLDLFLATVACFPLLLIVTVSIGALASVLCEDDGAAWVCTVVIGAILCLATPLPYYLGRTAMGSVPFSDKWLSISPAFGPYLVSVDFVGFSTRLFWLTVATNLVIALIALTLAALLLNRNWRQRVIVRDVRSGWRGIWQAWIHGSVSWRAGLRRKLLPQNPFQWLAQQNRHPLVLAWGLIVGVILIWLLGWLAWPRVWPSPMNFYMTALVLVIGTDFIMTYSAARRIGLDRRDGALELLLTTPLRPDEIVDGQLAAVQKQFLPVRVALLVLFAGMMAGGFFTRHWSASAIVSYVVIWGFFIGCVLYDRKGRYSLAMWVALNTGRPASALWHFGRQSKGGWWDRWWWIYWMFYVKNMWRGIGLPSSFPTGGVGEVVFVCFIAVVLFILAAAAQQSPPEMRERLIREMRLIAREPVLESSDPRYKKWNANERVPISAHVKSYPERMGQKMN